MKPRTFFFWILVAMCGLGSISTSADTIFDAAEKANMYSLEPFLNDGDQINAKTESGWTALHYAVWGGRVDENTDKTSESLIS